MKARTFVGAMLLITLCRTAFSQGATICNPQGMIFPGIERDAKTCVADPDPFPFRPDLCEFGFHPCALNVGLVDTYLQRFLKPDERCTQTLGQIRKDMTDDIRQDLYSYCGVGSPPSVCDDNGFSELRSDALDCLNRSFRCPDDRSISALPFPHLARRYGDDAAAFLATDDGCASTLERLIALEQEYRASGASACANNLSTTTNQLTDEVCERIRTQCWESERPALESPEPARWRNQITQDRAIFGAPSDDIESTCDTTPGMIRRIDSSAPTSSSGDSYVRSRETIDFLTDQTAVNFVDEFSRARWYRGAAACFGVGVATAEATRRGRQASSPLLSKLARRGTRFSGPVVGLACAVLQRENIPELRSGDRVVRITDRIETAAGEVTETQMIIMYRTLDGVEHTDFVATDFPDRHTENVIVWEAARTREDIRRDCRGLPKDEARRTKEIQAIRRLQEMARCHLEVQ